MRRNLPFHHFGYSLSSPNSGHFPCSVRRNLCWWAGPYSDPMFAPSPLLGPQSDWCVPYLPLSQGQDSLWSGVAPVWGACTLPGLWCCLDGIWPKVYWMGWICKVHRGWRGQAQLTLPLVVQFGRGPAALGGRQALLSEVSPEAQCVHCKHVR